MSTYITRIKVGGARSAILGWYISNERNIYVSVHGEYFNARFSNKLEKNKFNKVWVHANGGMQHIYLNFILVVKKVGSLKRF